MMLLIIKFLRKKPHHYYLNKQSICCSQGGKKLLLFWRIFSSLSKKYQNGLDVSAGMSVTVDWQYRHLQLICMSKKRLLQQSLLRNFWKQALFQRLVQSQEQIQVKEIQNNKKSIPWHTTVDNNPAIIQHIWKKNINAKCKLPSLDF